MAVLRSLDPTRDDEAVTNGAPGDPTRDDEAVTNGAPASRGGVGDVRPHPGCQGWGTRGLRGRREASLAWTGWRWGLLGWWD